jgi:hypothetical protein
MLSHINWQNIFKVRSSKHFALLAWATVDHTPNAIHLKNEILELLSFYYMYRLKVFFLLKW